MNSRIAESTSVIIIVGGGLAGCCAAHMALDHGACVVVLDKMPYLGGNSVKATGGVNAALTKMQRAAGIQDSPELFEEDTIRSAADRCQPELVHVLTHESAAAVEWLQSRFSLDLSTVGWMAGASASRCHRSQSKFPGSVITFRLIELLEKRCEEDPKKAKIVLNCHGTKLLTNEHGDVIGVEYSDASGSHTLYGPVILTTGGFAADFSENSLLATCHPNSPAWPSKRPPILSLPSTNGRHCTGDGIKMAVAVGAALCDMDKVQVHPTGLVYLDKPKAKFLLLASEALRGAGGLLLTASGERFVDELEKRDVVTGKMWSTNNAPYYLLLNSESARKVAWHCEHYCGRNVMRICNDGNALATTMGIPVQKLQHTFEEYNEAAVQKCDKFGKKHFHSVPFLITDRFYVSVVTPVVHYCMGGIAVNSRGEVKRSNTAGNSVVAGLYAAGEVAGGVHGSNRLGGNSLLDCVVYGRICGSNACAHLLTCLLTQQQQQQQSAPQKFTRAAGRLQTIESHLSHTPEVVTPTTTVSLQANNDVVTNSAAPASAKSFSRAHVAAHNKEADAWVIINKEVYDVTAFLDEHPGGKEAIVAFLGRDVTSEFAVVHSDSILQKYRPKLVIGNVSD